MSKYLEEFNLDLKNLTKKLLKSIAAISEKNPNYEDYILSIIKYINEHSLDYVPRKNEVLNNFEGLIEKLELNNQTEKTKLLQNYLNRLQTIYDNKSPINKDNLFSYINMIIKLAHSPLKTRVNLDLLKEQFESRYLANKFGGYDINTEYYNKVNEIEAPNPVEIPEVDYNEKTPSISEEEEEENSNNNINTSNNENENDIIMNNENNVNKNIIYENKSITYLPFTYEGQKEKGIVNDLLEYLYKAKTKLFEDKNYFNKMPKIFFNYMLTVNTRLNDNLIAKYDQVSSDFILFRILNIFIEDNKSDIASITKENFINKFFSINAYDISNELLKNIVSDVYKRRKEIYFLRKIKNNFEKANIHSLITDKLIYLITQFINVHDNVISLFIKLFYIQKGQIEKDYYDKIFINDSYKTNLNFLDSIIDYINYYVYQEMIINKNKFTLMRFINLYKEQFVPIIKYFSLILNYLYKIVKIYPASNKSKNCIINKYILDTLYYFAKSERKLYSEIFIHLMDIYIKFIYEFIINGNLIDPNNEFFIVHVDSNNSKDNKKSVFFFDQKYEINDWVNSFKIRSFSADNQECAYR